MIVATEPTAGAERGLENNKITDLIAKICLKLPRFTVLLSATLPDLKTELPTLVERFTSMHGGPDKCSVEMVTSLRLPVGCDALDATGVQMLPHQLADDFEEFKTLVKAMEHDALMQRFYTPASVRQLATCVENAVTLPPHLMFDAVVPHIGAVRHSAIRVYAQRLLEHVASNDIESAFPALKSMVLQQTEPVPCTAENLLKHHCVDGRALAVAATRRSPADNTGAEILDELIGHALAPYVEKLPKLSNFIAAYERSLEQWEAQGRSLEHAKVSDMP